jgi:hypothetical protein
VNRTARNLCVAGMLFSVALPAEPSPFEFPVPEGFVSLKETAAPPPMTRIDDFYYEEAKAFPTYAVRVGADGVDANFWAKVWPGAAPLSDMPSFAEKSLASSALKDGRVLSARLVEVGGVRSGRIEIETRRDGTEGRLLIYVLPGRAHWASVMLAAQRDAYDSAASAVDAVVPKVRGLSAATEAPNSGVVTAGDETQAKFGGTLALAALGGYLLNKLVRRRRPQKRSA